MRKSPSSLLRRAQHAAVSVAAVLSVTALGVIPAVAPAVAVDEQPQSPEQAPPSAVSQPSSPPLVAPPVSEQIPPAADPVPPSDIDEKAPQENLEVSVEKKPEAVTGDEQGGKPEDPQAEDAEKRQGYSAFRSMGDSCEFTPEYYLWVGMGRGNNYPDDPNDPKKLGSLDIGKIRVNDDFTGGEIVGKIESDVPFGDIAVVHDFRHIYGITFSLNDGRRIYQYEELNGHLNWNRPLAEKDTDGKDLPVSGFNSLSVGPNKELLFSSYKSDGIVYSVEPEKVDPNAGDQTPIPVKNTGMQFPKIRDTQIHSAGDFIVMPDESILGFGSDSNGTYIVKWKPKPDGTYSGIGTIIGTMDEKVYGAARVGSHILAVTNKESSGTGFKVLDIPIGDASEENGEDIVIKPKIFDVDDIWGMAWGASSSGDTGQLDWEGKLRTRVVFNPGKVSSDPNNQSALASGRAQGELDQAKIWSADSDGSSLAPKEITTGTDPGLQSVVQEEVVDPCSKHTVHQTLLRNGEAHAIAPFYKTRLVCVDGSGNTLLEKDFDSSSEDIQAEVTMPELFDPTQNHFLRAIWRDTTTCTFYNTPIQRPFSLPMTGARADFWQLFAGVVVLVGFAAFPLWRRRRVA